jgi:SAM-dependent methyltransferase
MNLEPSIKTVSDQSFWDGIVEQNKNVPPLAEGHWDRVSEGNYQNHNSPMHNLEKILNTYEIPNGSAIDVGAGIGSETVLLLQRNYTVTAIETNKCARKCLLENVVAQCKDKSSSLTLVDSPMEEYDFPNRVDLILANNSLPFCDPTKFQNLWNRMINGLLPGGIIYATFYPEKYKGTMVITLPQVKKLMETSFQNSRVSEVDIGTKYPRIMAIGQRMWDFPAKPGVISDVTLLQCQIFPFISPEHVDAHRLGKAVMDQDFNLLLRLVSADSQFIPLLQFLLAHRQKLNIDLGAKGKTSGTALDVATKKNNKEAIDILKKLK